MIEASELVAALEATWRAIQRRHGDVPDVVVTLGAGSIGAAPGRMRLGHYAPHRWTAAGDRPGLGTAALATSAGAGQSELFVGGEGLSLGATGVLETLLHEAAHGVAHARRIKDTSRDGRYHNARFRELGTEIGLTITQDPPIGWSGTALAPGTAGEYADELDELAAALVGYRYAETEVPAGDSGDGGDEGQDPAGGDSGGRKRPKNGLVLMCACPRKIRVSVSVADAGPILCGVCRAAFT